MRKPIFRAIGLLVTGLSLSLLLASNALADGGEPRHEVKAVDGYEIEMTYVAGDLELGHNQLIIQIKNQQGQLVEGARVNVVAERYEEVKTASSGHGGMDMGGQGSNAAESAAELKLVDTVNAEMKPGPQAGQYEGEIALDHAGHWMITVKALIQGREKTVSFAADVHADTSKQMIIWLFVGVNLGVIAVAGILKPKSAGTQLQAAKQ